MFIQLNVQDSVMMGRGSVTFNNMVDMLGGSVEDGDGETEDCDERVPLLLPRFYGDLTN